MTTRLSPAVRSDVAMPATSGQAFSRSPSFVLPPVMQSKLTGGGGGGGRAGRLRFSVTPGQRLSGGTALLFHASRPNGGSVIAAPSVEADGAQGRRQRRFMRSVAGDVSGESSAGAAPLTRCRSRSFGNSQLQMHGTMGEGPKGSITGPLSETSSLATVNSTRASVQLRNRGRKTTTGFDPGIYGVLLPATLKLRVAEETQFGGVVGVVASEMMAERDAQRASRGMALLNTNKMQAVPLLELRQFETKMKQLQERGRQMRRRWKRSVLGVPGSNGGAVMMIEDGDDLSSESGGEYGPNDMLHSPRSQRPYEKVENAKTVAVARKAQIDALQHVNEESRGTALLRRELQKSRCEVDQARNGLSASERLRKAQKHEEQVQVMAGEGTQPAGMQLSMEDVSWGADSIASLHNAASSPLSHSLSLITGTRHDSNSASGRRVSPVLRVLLHRGKTAMVYGLDPANLRSDSKKKEKLLLEPPYSSSEWAAPAEPVSGALTTSKAKSEKMALHAHKGNTHRPRKALPVEYGVGEQSRLLYETLVTESRIGDLQAEIQHGEDIRRTRQLLLDLRPERERLLDESLKHSHKNPIVILQEHRQQLFKEAEAMDVEERQQACFTFVDLLEERYRGEIADNSWPAVAKALQRTRDLIQISPSRCNLRSFRSNVKDCFLMSHLMEWPVREFLRRLAQLFDISTAQYKAVMANVYQRLDRPQNYQARFREIERTIPGMEQPPELRLRITVHRCRFVLTDAGTCAVVLAHGGALCHEGGVERVEVSVQLKSDHQTTVTTVAQARTNSADETDDMGARQRSSEQALRFVANMLDQAFRMQLCENGALEVFLLRSGQVMCSGVLRLSECAFNTRGVAFLWLRLSGPMCSQAEVKLTLEVLGDKERRKKLPK
ncbi:hypothetical protein DQ04_01871040 [Trypanosoma grayi]|uniref:hypothetical protein n=1 Tax=Trypanosoma grayi TaxID=71804 RepID=UPI0004F473E9|nr:hypothetical protein DQ04_01871040 [Trypanosoma grayi]KEG12236.1 hypothetical protein DQ04_01871040 [Trypanosoma grayi]